MLPLFLISDLFLNFSEYTPLMTIFIGCFACYILQFPGGVPVNIGLGPPAVHWVTASLIYLTR